MQGSDVARSDAMLQAFKHSLVSSFMHEADSSNKNSICYAMKASVALDKHVIRSSMRADISLPLLVTILASLSHYELPAEADLPQSRELCGGPLERHQSEGRQ